MANNYSKVLEGFIDLGMTEREAKVYLALLEKGSATAPLLQKISGVPQSKIYSTIDSLVRKGFFTERKVERKRLFEIIDPGITLDLLIRKLQTQLENSIQLKKELAGIHSNRERITEPFEYIEIARGDENVHSKYVNLLRDSKQEFLCFIRAPFAWYTDEMKLEQINEFRAFVKRGGESRWVYELNEDSPPFLLETVIEDGRAGENFRITDSLPLKMMIFDHQTLLIADEEQIAREGELTMAIIKQATMVKGYTALFDYFWNQALEFKEWERLHKSMIDQKLYASQ